MNIDVRNSRKNLRGLSLIFLVMLVIFFAVRYFFPVVTQILGVMTYAFLPFILALIIAILIDPLVDWITGHSRIKRGLACALTLIVLLVLIILALVLIISRLVVEINDIYATLPYYTQYWINMGLEFIGGIRTYFTTNPLPMEAQEALRSNLQDIMSGLAGLLSSSINVLFNLLTGLPGLVTIIIVAIIATFFISRDKHLIARFIYRLLPSRFIQPASRTVGDLNSALTGFFRAQVILISITTVLAITGLHFIGSKYALTMGILIGLLDLLPILGPGTVLIPWSAFHLLTASYKYGLALLVLYGILVGVRQLIEPKILSDNIGLHPLATLMSLYLGLQFFGVAGIIIGPFLVILFKSVFRSIFDKD